MHISRVNLALDDVQNGDIAALLARNRRHHAVFGLEEAPHHVKDSRLADRLRLLDLIACERRVCCHEEVATWRRNKRS